MTEIPSTTQDGDGERSVSVLLIEDEQDVREMYALHLQREYTVLTAADGAVPIETVEQADIVFCDRRMPTQSGDEFLRRIRRAGIDVPVVFISAVKEEVEVDAEYQGYLTKPTSGETLKEYVATYADSDQARTAG